MGRLVAGLLLLAVALTGCAGDGGIDEAVVLRVLMADDWADSPPIIEAVRGFEEDNPQVRVDVVGRPFGQITAEVEASVTVGRPLDVIQEHAFAAGARGLAEPIDDWWTQQDAGDWFPGAITDVTWGDTRYGVPLDINALFMVANTDLVDSPPEDFGALRALADDLGDDVSIMAVEASNWVSYGWIRANGGEVVEVGDEGMPTFTLDRPENIEALQMLAELVDSGDAVGPTVGNAPTDILGMFTQRETALMVTGTWDTAVLTAEHPDLPLQTAPMPRGADGTTEGSVLGGSSVFVGRGSTNHELALAFIEAITADDVAIAMAQRDGRLPPKPELFRAAGLDDPVYDGVVQQLQTAHPQRLIAFPEAQAAFEVAVDDAITGRLSAADALQRAQEVAERGGG